MTVGNRLICASSILDAIFLIRLGSYFDLFSKSVNRTQKNMYARSEVAEMLLTSAKSVSLLLDLVRLSSP